MLADIVRWSLMALVLVAAVIGFLFATRGTAVRRVRGVGVDAAPVSPSEPEFPVTVAMLTGASTGTIGAEARTRGTLEY